MKRRLHQIFVSLLVTLSVSSFVFAQTTKKLALPPTASEIQKQLESETPENLPPKKITEEKKTTPAWTEFSKTYLNFLELHGYFRLRGDFFQRCDLGTYIPGENGNPGRGTSSCPVPLTYETAAAQPTSGDIANQQRDLPGSIFSTNMRLRVDPTVHVSEDIRLRMTVDALDNLVLGSTPRYMGGGQANPSDPMPFLSLSQNYPQLGVNSPFPSIAVKRVWAEVSTPVGELRFGRMPMHWGLGILYNSGNGFDDDHGDNIDGILFASRIRGHYLIPSYSIAFAGPTGRGGGLGLGGDQNTRFLAGETGQRIDLDPADGVHQFSLTFAKMTPDEDLKSQLHAGDVVVDYGVLGSYRFQIYDPIYPALTDQTNSALSKQLVQRNAHAGLMSLWSAVNWDTLKVEGEFAGILGRINDTTGFAWADSVSNKSQPLWLLQGGAALKTQYGFLKNRLRVGLDGGWASGDSAPGMGARPGLNSNPKAGDADGQQFGGCKDAGCAQADDFLTNFRFNPDYRVDLILFREVLGTITDAFYVRPHIAYYFTDLSGVRADVISSFSNFAASTPGNSNFLGLELDASAFYQSRDGFYVRGQFGVLFPFSGLNHNQTVKDTQPEIFAQYGTARTAYAVKVFAGINF